ncbi:MAG: hypothetical protein U9P00_14790 [Pseudomonadota bacterium]|nr:hypothetical protein [Pseudomonadota bacterium]
MLGKSVDRQGSNIAIRHRLVQGICLFLTKVHNRVIRHGFSQLNNGCPKAPNRPIASTTRQLDRAMDQLIVEVVLAA